MKLLLILALLILPACAWQLSGQSFDMPIVIGIKEQPNTQVKLAQRDLVIDLKRYYSTLNSTQTSAVHYGVTVLNYRLQDRTATINSSNRARQKELIATLDYALQTTDQTSNRAVYRVTAKRYYYQNETNVMASENERNSLVEALHNELAQRLWLQVQRLNQSQ